MTASSSTSKPTAAMDSPHRARLFALTGIAVAALVIGLSLWTMAAGSDTPRLNEDTVTLARFVSTPDYTKLPFDKQSLYMKVLEDREDNGELKKAFEALKLSESDYRAARQEAWLGEQLKRSEKFAGLSPGPARTKFINELLDKKARKKAQEAKPGKDNSDANDIKRDQSLEKERISTWPPEVRLRWEEFRKAYNDQKDAREQATTPSDKPTPAK